MTGLSPVRNVSCPTHKENGCPRELSIRKSISKLDHAVSELIAQGKDEEEITRELNSIIQKHSTKTSPELAA